MSDDSEYSEGDVVSGKGDVIGTKQPMIWMISFLSSLEEGLDIDEAWVYAQTAAWVEESDPSSLGKPR